jgi:hypothetical protein
VTLDRRRWLAHILLAGLVGALFGYGLGFWDYALEYVTWAHTTPLRYSESDTHYVELALDVYTGRSAQKREDALKEVYPLVVDLPGAVCVAMHPRPGRIVDSVSTMCFDNETDALLTHYHSETLGQHMPAKLNPPHFGEVIEYRSPEHPTRGGYDRLERLPPVADGVRGGGG